MRKIPFDVSSYGRVVYESGQRSGLDDIVKGTHRYDDYCTPPDPHNMMRQLAACRKCGRFAYPWIELLDSPKTESGATYARVTPGAAGYIHESIQVIPDAWIHRHASGKIRVHDMDR